MAEPLALAARVYVRVPPGLIAGWELNSALRSLLTMKSTAWLDSSEGPVLMAVAQLADGHGRGVLENR